MTYYEPIIHVLAGRAGLTLEAAKRAYDAMQALAQESSVDNIVLASHAVWVETAVDAA